MKQTGKKHTKSPTKDTKTAIYSTPEQKGTKNGTKQPLYDDKCPKNNQKG